MQYKQEWGQRRVAITLHSRAFDVFMFSLWPGVDNVAGKGKAHQLSSRKITIWVTKQWTNDSHGRVLQWRRGSGEGNKVNGMAKEAIACGEKKKKKSVRLDHVDSHSNLSLV